MCRYKVDLPVFEGSRKFRTYTEEDKASSGQRRKISLVIEYDRFYGLWCDVFKAELNRRQHRKVEKDLRMAKKERQTLPFRIRINRGWIPGFDL